MAFTTIPGSGGNDVTSLIGTSGVDTALIQGLNERVFVNGLGDFDVIDFLSSTNLVSDFTIQGGDGNDAIRSIGTNAVRSLFNGNDGADIITIDAITQGSVFGGQGADLISLSTLSNVILNGNQGADLINLFVGASSSSLFGGKDNDQFLLGGDFTFADIRGDNGNDQIQLFTNSSLNNSTINGNAGNDVIRLLGSVSMDGTNSTIYGGAGDDVIDAVANSLSSILAGSNGNDSITGGSSADSLFGGDGNDLIVGSNGADRMRGDAGADSFAYAAGSGGQAQTGNVLTGVIDRILDFTSGVDLISGLGVSGSGQFDSFLGGFATYADARVGVANQLSLDGDDYVVTAYGSGSAWTAVLFLDILNPALDPFTPLGAIQIGTTGQYASQAQAIAAITASDILA